MGLVFGFCAKECDMKQLWMGAGMWALLAALAAPAPTHAQSSAICDLFPNLPGCSTGGCDCDELADRVSALEQGQEVQNAAIASLAAAIADIHSAITELETCCDENSAAIDGLQDQIDQIIDFLGGDCTLAGLDECNGACTDLDTDPANCGECGNVCDANQNCIGGQCEFKVCPEASICQVAVLNEDGSCTNVPLTGDPCDDGLQCTTEDSCLNGTCVGGGNPCDAGETCVEGSGDPPICVGGGT
jgi:hypothetical protein